MLYAFVGIAFALPQEHVRFWRLGAWVVSAFAFGAQLVWERFRLHASHRAAATHVALAAALGAFGLAVGANLHALGTGQSAQHQRLLLIALAAWPAITFVPAFLVGYVASVVLARTQRGRGLQHPSTSAGK